MLGVNSTVSSCDLTSENAAAALPPQPGLLSIGKISKLYGLSSQHLRQACRAGKLDCIVLESGHRRFSQKQLLKYLNLENAGENSTGETGNGKALRVGIVARVSGNEQNQKNQEGTSDLSRQVARLEQHAAEHYPGSQITKYVRCASGINLGHVVLLKLLTDIQLFKLDVVLVEFVDRLCRWGKELIQLTCDLHNCKLIFIAEDKDKSDEQELADDLLNIIHIFSCSKYGRRSAARLKVQPSPSQLSLILDLAYNQKLSTYAIVEHLKAAKELSANGKAFSRRVVRRIITDNKSFKAAINGNGDTCTTDTLSPASSIQEFIDAQIRQTIAGRRCLDFAKVKRAYRHFCKVKGYEEASSRQILSFLKSHFPTCRIERNKKSGTFSISGLSLHDNKAERR